MVAFYGQNKLPTDGGGGGINQPLCRMTLPINASANSCHFVHLGQGGRSLILVCFSVSLERRRNHNLTTYY